MSLRVQRNLDFVLRLISTSCALNVLGKNEGMDGGVVQNNLVGWHFGSTMIGGIVLPFCKGGVGEVGELLNIMAILVNVKPND